MGGLPTSIVLFALLVLSTSAQTQPAQVFITWKARNFYPSYFEGKALPTLNSPVTVSMEAAKNGAWLDTSPYDISWELDGKYIGGGRGVKQATFIVTKGAGDTHFIRVSMTRGEETIGASLRIPVGNHTVVIDAPYPNGRGKGGAITLRAIPFFFNLSSLSDFSFMWIVDGTRQNTGSDSALTISGNSDLAPRTFSVSLEAQNQANPQEIASARGQFSIQP